jgi:DnaJ-class molecular chaperone
MGYKHNDPCLTKAFDDERLFVLMARDPTAPAVIRYWMELNQHRQPREKLVEATSCAMEMERRCEEFNKRKEMTLPLQFEQSPSDLEWCDQCDGCGWYEGGPALKTACTNCNGTGQVKKKHKTIDQ